MANCRYCGTNCPENGEHDRFFDCQLYTDRRPTNADRIRSMNDEELAEYIFDLGNGSEYCYGHCAYQDDCVTKGFDHGTCMKGVIDWLRQPAKEEI